MNGKPVTDELVETWKELRRQGKSYEEIAAPTGHNPATVSKRIGDGKSVRTGRPLADPELFEECGGDMAEYKRRRKRQRQANRPKKSPGRHIEYPWLLEECGGDKDEYQRRRKQLNNANRARSKQQKAKVYDSDKRWDREWKAAGSPPPRYGRPCTCPVPLLDDDSLCDYCGCFRPAQTSLHVLTSTSPIPSSLEDRTHDLRQERIG